MSKLLYVLRHAKAESASGLNDAQRPLAMSGRHDVESFSHWLKTLAQPPEHGYVSSAQRTLETAELLTHSIPHSLYDMLYLASAGDLIAFVQQLPDTQASAMLIGHNPGLHELVLTLCRADASDVYDRLGLSFPTCACAVIALDIESWRDIAPQCGSLETLWSPKEAG